jgi:hypothetical protein
MAEIFGRIANISDVESKLPSTKKDATLWETEEQALRFLLEDGKLNLCLRNLIEFKTGQTKARKAERGAMVPHYSILWFSVSFIFNLFRSILSTNAINSKRVLAQSCAMPGCMWRCCRPQTYRPS